MSFTEGTPDTLNLHIPAGQAATGFIEHSRVLTAYNLPTSASFTTLDHEGHVHTVHLVITQKRLEFHCNQPLAISHDVYLTVPLRSKPQASIF
jgi:hypothetical protein